MCSQKTGSACGTSGSRELCRGGVPHERAARLQAAGFGTIDVSLSSAKSGARHRIANTVERTGREAHAVRYRRLTAMLVREGVPANHKRVYRLYREEGLAMRIRQRRRIRWNGAVVKPAASQPNERWSMDFVSEVDTSLGGFRVRRVLDRMASERGLPERSWWTTGQNFADGPWRPGANNVVCDWISFSQASLRRMPTSKASTAGCATNV
jgi:hypothetical protein